MDLQEAMEKRHSVRTYTAQKITGDVKRKAAANADAVQWRKRAAYAVGVGGAKSL